MKLPLNKFEIENIRIVDIQRNASLGYVKALRLKEQASLAIDLSERLEKLNLALDESEKSLIEINDMVYPLGYRTNHVARSAINKITDIKASLTQEGKWEE